MVEALAYVALATTIAMADATADNKQQSTTGSRGIALSGGGNGRGVVVVQDDNDNGGGGKSGSDGNGGCGGGIYSDERRRRQQRQKQQQRRQRGRWQLTAIRMTMMETKKMTKAVVAEANATTLRQWWQQWRWRRNQQQGL